MQMYWAPADYFAADPTIVEHAGRFHLFFESTTAEPVAGEPRGPLSICHYVSDDLVGWSALPVALRVGAQGEWDGYLLYHLDVVVTGGVWWMFYTGLDKAGNGQRQRVGIATSPDGITWQKHPGNPVLTGTGYERSIPVEGSHRAGNKDLGREWFRDPFVMFDKARGRWVMAVVARDPSKPVDARACVAGFSSEDLVHWQDEGPIFSPGRFHTVETPSIFAWDGKHYLVYMSSPSWGVPIYSSDSGQNAGNYVAVSSSGPLGPYTALEDEILIASAGALRLGAQRVLSVSDGRLMLYGWVGMRPTPDDVAAGEVRTTVFPTLKPVKVMPGHVRVEASRELCGVAREPVAMAGLMKGAWTEVMEVTAQGVMVRSYAGRGAGLFEAGVPDLVVEAQITFGQGERAGLAFRCDAQGRTGLAAVLDRRQKRVELVWLGGPGRGGGGEAEAVGMPIDSPTFVGGQQAAGFIDSRDFYAEKTFHMMVACQGGMVEVYVDGRLLIQQARHREQGVYAGVFVERAGAGFEGVRWGGIVGG